MRALRAVGTNTLRQAQNGLPFLVRARRALGHPIEVIAGREEARLIYQGVAHDHHEAGRRLVVDIGGGSTEVIVGEGMDPVALDSLYMGCVSWSKRYFPKGILTKDRMNAALTASRRELETVDRRYRALGWTAAVGSSGTIVAVERVLEAARGPGTGITPDGLRWLRGQLVKRGKATSLDLAGLKPDRKRVFAGGVAILSAVVEALGIEAMTASGSALREGLLWDLVGRIQHADARDSAVRRLAARFAVDDAQAARVEATAAALFAAAAGPWELDPDRDGPLLGWAARLHELGMFIAYSGYHKHGAYVLSQGDIEGFSRGEQRVLGALVLAHRGLLTRARMREVLTERHEHWLRLAVLLRLAVVLHRSRSPDEPPALSLTVDGADLALGSPPGWLEAHPLLQADLDEEGGHLKRLGFRLSVG